MRNLIAAATCCVLCGGVAVRAAEPAPDFSRAGRTFLERHCLACHTGKEPKGSLALDGFRDAASLVPHRKTWDALVQRVVAGEMPPEGKPRPTQAEIAAFVAIAKAVYDHADRTTPPDPGRVTMRRLNRVEYRNTVRDLLHVDFDPTESFPADDVGHGFDNIGDVLSLSPLLLERYLDAAETIAARAVVPNPPKPAVRYLAGKYLQPNNAQTPQGRFRPLDPTSKDPTQSGPFTGAGDYLKLRPDDDLVFRATLYAEPKGKSPVQVALFLSGPNIENPSGDAEVAKLTGAGLEKLRPLRIVKVFEIAARTSSKPQTIEVPVHRVPGIVRAGLALVAPPEGEEPPRLFVEHLWSEGPLETRPLSHRTLLACTPGRSVPEQTREVLERLLSRAYRRPATKPEVEALAVLVDESVADGTKWESAVQSVLPRVLCSPKFLFRVELDDRPEGPGMRALDEFQLASRLSYFLWGSMPDDELFAAARERRLARDLESQVRRLLRDPRAESLVDRFALQWLQLGRLDAVAPDRELFPKFDDVLRTAMIGETRATLLELVREDLSVLELLRSDHVWVNEVLARHYGIVDTLGNRLGDKIVQRGQPIRGPQFVRVPVPDDERGGLLTQASLLTVTSNPTRTSPVKRGRWVLEQILGAPPPPPPPNVPELEAQKGVLTGSLKQQMEQHRRNPACATCHTQMDALGFAFENYDAIGAFRMKDGEHIVDPSGTLPDGRTINGPGDLKKVLLERKEAFVRSLAEKLLTFAIGRGLEPYDRRAVDRIVAGTVEGDFKFSRLVLEVTRSDPFRMRRGSDAKR